MKAACGSTTPRKGTVLFFAAFAKNWDYPLFALCRAADEFGLRLSRQARHALSTVLKPGAARHLPLTPAVKHRPIQTEPAQWDRGEYHTSRHGGIHHFPLPSAHEAGRRRNGGRVRRARSDSRAAS